MSTWYMFYQHGFSDSFDDWMFPVILVGVFAIVGIGMLLYEKWSNRIHRKKTIKQFEEFKNRQE